MNRSARACDWEEGAETEAPFACPDEEYMFILAKSGCATKAHET